jgi:hypothetical protein
LPSRSTKREPPSAKRPEFGTYKKIARGTRHESKPAIKRWVSCSSGRAGLHYFRPARPEAFVLQKRIRRCMRKSLRIRTYTKTGEGVPPRCHRHQDIRGATKSGERNTCGQKQIPRAKCALVMTASGRGCPGWRAQGAAAGLNVAPGSLARHPAPAWDHDDCGLPAVRNGVV